MITVHSFSLASDISLFYFSANPHTLSLKSKLIPASCIHEAGVETGAPQARNFVIGNNGAPSLSNATTI